ncbi:hypothetical protein Rmet_1987 [Cupriavidus metallidurans CH34]|uniref:Uncharacterized protein n=1 Tax=Cupriavidus metallidurans (strain ATCC 43123 / DSM 2839 / NBRC 102507 / CH34) TaxID=266264 RepID=Q1LLW0_CUPMC|nr:hypothetical protein Rmet_1987 [Cupriavidus metallidurans CH34]
MADGTRTHDDRNHNPGLYQLSYSHRRDSSLPTLPLSEEQDYTCLLILWLVSRTKNSTTLPDGFIDFPATLPPAAQLP